MSKETRITVDVEEKWDYNDYVQWNCEEGKWENEKMRGPIRRMEGHRGKQEISDCKSQTDP